MSMIHQDDDEILMTENETYDSDDDAEIQMGEIEVRSEEFEDEYDDDTNDSELSSPAITPSSASAARNSADHTTVFSNSQHEQQNSSPQQVNLSNSSSNNSSSTNVKSSKSFAGNAKECIKTCVRFGKLYKKGNNRSGFKGEWRQRIIVLSMDRKIYYYKTVDDKTPLGVLHLNDNCLIKRCDFQDGIDKQFAFKIEKYDSSKPDKQFVVHCSSEKEVSDWLQALTSATGRSLNVSSQATEQQLQSNKWYRTISEAIDAAYGGEKIFIYSGVYREQLIVQKSVILEGVVSLEANKKQQEARKKFDEEKTRRETVLQNRENVLRTMSIRVGPLDLSKQHSELAKQQDEIRRMSMAVSSGSDSPRHRGTLNRRQVEPVNDIVETKSSDSGYIEFGNISDVVLECPYEQQPAIIYKTNGGILSNITIGTKESRALSNGTSYKKEVEDLITNKDEPMVNCIEMDNGSLTLKNCTINCHTGSGILCMNQSSIELDNCDIFKVRDMGIWTWDRSSVTARGSRVLGAGVDGIRLNGKSTVKLDNCQVINSGLFGVCAVDASVCTLTNCVVRQATADAIRVQNDANCNVVRSEISHSQEYGIGIYNQLDLMSITVTNDCKMEQNKLGDFAQKSQVKMIH